MIVLMIIVITVIIHLNQLYMAINIIITDEQLRETFKIEIYKLLETGNYSNPVKACIDKLFGYSGQLTGVLGEQIKAKLESFMEDKEFQKTLGEALAKALVERHIKLLEKK